MLLPRARQNPYRGNDAKKLRAMKQDNAYAAQINSAIERLYDRQQSKHQMYDFSDIAYEAELGREIIARIGLNNGSNTAISLTKESCLD